MNRENLREVRNQRGRSCGTMWVHSHLLRVSPEYRRRRREVEEEIDAYIKRYQWEGLRYGIVTIPVVVHVVHHTSTENISDAQIQSQIDVLNEDYRRLNTDASSTPTEFQSVAADVRIQFQLAVRDPDCNPTNGITRTATTVAMFSYTNSTAVKSNATGGHDPWPADKYLNIWVCSLDVLGYATFPGSPAAQDGVVIAYDAFGRTGTAASPFNLGRTATHEIGHWFDLLHVWGDDNGACTGSDNVDDTPNQAGPNYGCPAFPHVSCSNGPDGDMFMNFMDYTDDACMNMFTAGQGARMDAALYTTRASIVASDGLIPPAPGGSADLWSKDNGEDNGNEPSSGRMYTSDDIWIRNQNDGVTNQEHQNPEYRPPGSQPNYVYVRIRNRGCGESASGIVKLYWAKASSGLSWPAPWDGSVTTPALMGGVIGTQPVTVAGGDYEILTFPWMPPNPADYATFGADQAHFCLLSRIETSTTPPYGMTAPEGSDLGANVRNNNNIVWKNISIVDEEPGSGRIEVMLVTNPFDGISPTKITFTAPEEEISIFEWADVMVNFDEKLVDIWRNGRSLSRGVELLGNNTFWIGQPGAWIGNLELDPMAQHSIQLNFVPKEKQQKGVHIYCLDVVQYGQDSKGEDRIIGGQRFVYKVRPSRRRITLDDAPLHFDGVTWVA